MIGNLRRQPTFMNLARTLHMTRLSDLKKQCAPGALAHFGTLSRCPLIWKLRDALTARMIIFKWRSYQFQVGMIKSVQITQALRTLSLLDSAIELWESLRCLICFEAFAWAKLLQQRTNVRHYWHCTICTPHARTKSAKNTTLPLYATLKLEKLMRNKLICSLSSAFSCIFCTNLPAPKLWRSAAGPRCLCQ